MPESVKSGSRGTRPGPWANHLRPCLSGLEGPRFVRRSAKIETEELVLRDQAGTARVRLMLNPDGSPELVLYDADGGLQLKLDSPPGDVAGLTFYDKGDPRIRLATERDGSAGLEFLGKEREGLSSLTVSADDEAPL